MKLAPQLFISAITFFIWGCAPAKKVVLPPVAPAVAPPTIPPPQFERTFGDISVGKSASLLLKYKSITLLIDPDFDAVSAAALSSQVDYVLLTDASLRHFNAAAQTSLRKNIKIIASPEESDKVKSQGFSEVKGLSAGPRVMLKKNNDFVFVTAVQNRNPETKLQVNSYLLEFDNGRNIFISGEVSNADALREFVYGLRDDGKEIYAGFFYRQTNMTEETMAQIVSLIQPKATILTQGDLAGLPKLNEETFRDALKNELFEGPFLAVESGRQIPF